MNKSKTQMNEQPLTRTSFSGNLNPGNAGWLMEKLFPESLVLFFGDKGFVVSLSETGSSLKKLIDEGVVRRFEMLGNGLYAAVSLFELMYKEQHSLIKAWLMLQECGNGLPGIEPLVHWYLTDDKEKTIRALENYWQQKNTIDSAGIAMLYLEAKLLNRPAQGIKRFKEINNTVEGCEFDLAGLCHYGFANKELVKHYLIGSMVMANTSADWTALALAWAQWWHIKVIAKECLDKAEKTAAHPNDYYLCYEVWQNALKNEKEAKRCLEMPQLLVKINKDDPDVYDRSIENKEAEANSYNYPVKWLDCAMEWIGQKCFNRALRCLKKAELYALSFFDWHACFLVWSRIPNMKDEASRCFEIAENNAMFFSDWISCANEWDEEFNNLDQAERCLKKAEENIIDTSRSVEMARTASKILNSKHNIKKYLRKGEGFALDSYDWNECEQAWIELVNDRKEAKRCGIKAKQIPSYLPEKSTVKSRHPFYFRDSSFWNRQLERFCKNRIFFYTCEAPIDIDITKVLEAGFNSLSTFQNGELITCTNTFDVGLLYRSGLTKELYYILRNLPLNYQDHHDLLFLYLFLRGDTDRAKILFEQSYKTAPPLSNHYIFLQYMLKDTDRALDCLEQMLNLEASDNSILIRSAKFYMLDHDNNKMTEECLQKAGKYSTSDNLCRLAESILLFFDAPSDALSIIKNAEDVANSLDDWVICAEYRMMLFCDVKGAEKCLINAGNHAKTSLELVFLAAKSFELFNKQETAFGYLLKAKQLQRDDSDIKDYKTAVYNIFGDRDLY